MNRPIIDNSINGVRSKHNTSCNWTGTTDFGRLVPFHIEELDPTVHVETCRPRIELQMLPLASPTFGKLDMYVHYFFVPLRLLDEGAPDRFERQGTMKNSTPPYITPYDLAHYYQSLSSTGQKRAFFKHWTSIGLPPFFTLPSYNANTTINNKWHLTLSKFRAYNQIWWDFYRDPELLRDDTKLNYVSAHNGHWNKNDGVFGLADERCLQPRVRTMKDCWIANLFSQSGESPSFERFAALDYEDFEQNSSVSGQDVILDDNPAIFSVDDTSRQLRKIEALTRLSERLSLGGKRAIDAMFAAYGVKPNFLKLQMAQYVGGAKSTVLVSDITSSADTITFNKQGDSTFIQGSPLGQKAGAGYATLDNINIDFTAAEHGYLVGIVSVMPHIHFNQGLDKSWFRNEVTDWFTKSLERTGQVAVSKKEIGLNSQNSPNYSSNEDDETFAFCQPYYENKMGRDILAGDFAYYHNVTFTGDEDVKDDFTPQYMQSMEMYVDYPLDRLFDAENMKIDAVQFNKIFYYLGGSMWTDSDDHFHLSIEKQVIKDTPYDGYAVPTLETTQDPHKSSAPVGGDKVL